MITVRALKYDGSEHRRWTGRLLRKEGSLIVLDAIFPDEISHELLGTITSGTSSIEYYWLDRWYNVFRFAKPSGQLRNYYCNINAPAQFDGQDLSYVDLDMDILVEPDYSYQVIDRDDFDRNAIHYGYSDETRANALRALDELTALIQTRSFPFNV